MRALVISSAILLAACGQQPTELPEPPPAQQILPAAEEANPAPAQALTTGQMGAMSTTAMSITGAATFKADAIEFENGFAAQTEFLEIVSATNPIKADGESFAAAAPGPTDLRIEIRRIAGEAPPQLCGGPNPATYIAIASDEPLTALTLMVFSGTDAPGPSAQDSTICAIFSYAVD